MKTRIIKALLLLCALSSSIMFVSCASKNKELSSVLKYAQKNFKNIDLSQENCIFIIGEKGCIGCNQRISLLASQYLNKEGNVYFIINPSNGGTTIDISPYWDATKQDNISFDSTGYFDSKKMSYSYIVFTNNNKTDTLLLGLANTMDYDTTYTKQRLSTIIK